MDGVLADFYGHLMTVAEREVAGFQPIPKGQVTNWWVHDLVPVHQREAVIEVCCQPGFYLNFPPIEGAVEVVQEIARRYRVYLCSSPQLTNPTCASDKLAWVDQHLGADWCNKLILTGDKSLVVGELLIDDKPHIRTSFEPFWQQLLFDNGWGYCPIETDLPVVTWQNWEQVFEWARKERLIPG